MPAGYSGTPLLKKFGIMPEMKVLLINQPDDYHTLLAEGSSGETNIHDQYCKKNETPDFVHLFVKTINSLKAEMKKLKIVYKMNTSAIIWVSWYKKPAKLLTDVTDDMIRNYALKNGLVDVKVCAVSGLWSGLKLVVPLAKR